MDFGRIMALCEEGFGLWYRCHGASCLDK